MKIEYLKKSNYLKVLKSLDDQSIDSIVILSFHILKSSKENTLKEILNQCVRVLKDTGILLIQGIPRNLPDIVVPLTKSLHFKYWIAIDSKIINDKPGLPFHRILQTSHAALVLFSKSKNSFEINKARFPHQYCSFCNKTLKDWGGKSHLMNPIGYAISDVWRNLPKQNNYSMLSIPALQAVLQFVDNVDDKNGKCLIFPYEGINFGNNSSSIHLHQKSKPPLLQSTTQINRIDESLLDVVHCGDAVETLKKYPDNSVDLVFADPPYNLDKAYNSYDDEKEYQRYIDWCNSWLKEYIRILKPTGSLYLLNLPKWAIHHASFLNQYLYFQNWIVWDAVSEPRGKIMPAHYALLFYTKNPTKFTFNYKDVSPIDAPYFCIRQSCIKMRKDKGIDPKVPLTDIWWDIHRIKHKRERDQHPCQLPEKLMERIISLSSNKGDIVLDALSGVGTTAAVAYRLGRRYVAIDVDKHYVDITRKKIEQLKTNGFILRTSIEKKIRTITKKELQLELKEIALSLGRLPSEKEVENMSRYSIHLFKESFPTWSKALKAARVELLQNAQT